MARKMLENHDLLPIAVDAAEEAAEFIRQAQRPKNPTSWTRKGDHDFVTDIDRTAERLIATHLTTRVPDSTVRGEELSPESLGDDLIWVVDPLDGTTNYLHGYPMYAVSVAAVHHGVPRVGVVVDVAGRHTYTAVQGEGASLDGRPLRVSQLDDPSAALIGTGFPFKAPELLERYLTQFATVMRQTSGVRRAGAAALDLVDVALGRFDGFWELDLAPWDVAAGTLLVREAGGIVSDTDGSENVIKHGSIVAGNPAIYRWLMQQLRAR